MRIAVPLFDDDVAPRFCAARSVLIVDVQGEDRSRTDVRELPQGSLPQRLGMLGDLRVTHLLCGGFNRRFLPMAEGLGMKVEWGIWGNAQEAVRDYSQGRPLKRSLPSGGGAGRGRGRGAGRGGGARGRGGGRGRNDP